MRSFCPLCKSKLPLSTPEHQPYLYPYPDSLLVFLGVLADGSIPLEACCHWQKVLSWLLRTASCWIADLALSVAGISQKRWWTCIGQFEDKCWGILGHPHVLVPDFWGRQSCCSWCSGNPGRLARWNVDVQIANLTHFLMTGAKHLLETSLQLLSIHPNSPCQCCKCLEEGDGAERKSHKRMLFSHGSYLLP